MFLSLISLMLLLLPVQAKEIYISPGRISLIDLGSLIKSEIHVLDTKLARAYALSGLTDEEKKTVIAIQGLKNHGKTDLTVKTSAGIEQFTLIANEKKVGDLVLDPTRQLIDLSPEIINFASQRSAVIQLKTTLNQYLLSGDPDLIQFRQMLDYYDQDFLKTISVYSSSAEGLTDLVLATQSGVKKITVEIKKGNEHENKIEL